MPYIGTSPSNGVRRVHTYTATASQDTFTGASSEGVTLSYVDTNYIDVFQNGVLLGSADYTSTSGTSVVLAQGASADDLIVIVVYDVFSVADTVSKTNGGSFDSAVTMSDNLTVSGAFTSQGIDDNADATAITIDSSENVGIGGTPDNFGGMIRSLEIKGTSDVELSLHATSDSLSSGARIGQIVFNAGSDSTVPTVSAIRGVVEGTDENKGHLSFHTRNNDTGGLPDERMRVDNSGKLLLGATSAIANAGGARFQLSQSNNNWVHYIENYASSGNIFGTLMRFSGSSPDNTTSAFMKFQDSGGTIRCNIYSDGDLYNHDGTYAQISDRRIKDNITDANSQWDDIKAMRFVNYQRKDDIRQYGESEAKVQLGLIGQELEAISPSLVRSVEPDAGDIISSSEFGSLYVEGDDIPEGKQVGDVKEVKDKVKGVAYSILYMKAVKALQEAMTRIETLEAKVTALENAE